MGGGRLAVLGGAAGVRRACLYEAAGWFGAVSAEQAGGLLSNALGELSAWCSRFSRWGDKKIPGREMAVDEPLAGRP